MTRKYLSCADTAKLVRQALKEAFPGVKFGVRSDTCSGGASIRIGWIDGPTSAQVKSVVDTFEGGYFDGMIDYKGSVYHTLDGESVKFGADFIFENPEHSDELLRRGIAAVVEAYGGCEAITVEQYRRGDAWNWRNSGGCDLGRALTTWLAGKSDFDRLPGYAGIEPKESATVARVKFAGSDEYGAPYGSNGYPNNAAQRALAHVQGAQ